MATLVVGAVVLASCGGGSGSTKASPSADKTAAEKISLKQSDFPSGWTSNPHRASPTEAATAGRLARCLGIADPASHTTAYVHSPDFNKGQATMAASEVRFLGKDSDAIDELAGFQSGKGPGCFKQAFQPVIQERLPSGMTASNLDVQQFTFPTLRDGTAAYRASFTIPVAGNNVPVYADFVVFRAGRALINLFASSLGSPFDTKLEQDQAKKMADRA
jgi:hypothetical protein